jgi:hypothetical protein
MSSKEALLLLKENPSRFDLVVTDPGPRAGYPRRVHTIVSPSYHAVCEFLKGWQPERAVDYPLLKEVRLRLSPHSPFHPDQRG